MMIDSNLPTVTDSNVSTNTKVVNFKNADEPAPSNTNSNPSRAGNNNNIASNEYNIYNFDDVEYTHLPTINQSSFIVARNDDVLPNNFLKISNMDNSCSSNNNNNMNNYSNNIPLANHNNHQSMNVLNNSDTFSSFNVSLKENACDTQNKKFFHIQKNDASSLIIDLNDSSRSHCSSHCSSSRSTTSSSKRSNTDNNSQVIEDPHMTLYDCNSMLDQFNNDFNSFKCRIVPATFTSNFNENMSSISIKKMLKPTMTSIKENSNNRVELIVKDDDSPNCNDIHLLQNLLDKFENFYHGPVTNMEKNTLSGGSKNLQ